MHLALLLSLVVVQDPPKVEEKVIYGTSPLKGQQLFDAPYSADLVDDDDVVRRRMSRTLPEALEEIPGVSVQKTGPGQGSPFIRGFTGFRNVLMIDGVRLNNSVFREGPNQYWSTVDSYLVDRMELIRGPSSVLYGSDSMGGTLLVRTTEPTTAGAGFGGRSIFRYASHEESFQARQEFSMAGDGVGAMIGGTWRDYGDIRAGGLGPLEETGYEGYAADAKVVFALGTGSKIVVAVQHDRTQDSPRWHRTVNNDDRWQGTAAGTEFADDFDQERNLYYVQYHGTYENAVVDAVKLGLSWHRQAEDENRLRRPTSSDQFREFEVDTPGFFAQAGKRTGIGYVTVGVDAWLDRVKSDGTNITTAGVVQNLPRGSVAGEAEYLLWGVYLQDEFSVGALDVLPGIRFSRASVDAEDVDPSFPANSPLVPDTLEDDYQAVTGSLRLVYHLNEEWNAIAGWGMGFRAPSLDDTTGSAAVASGSVDFGGPDLDPEKSHTFDLGVRSDYRTWGASAFAFYTLLRDFINRVNIGDVNGDTVDDFGRVNAAEGWVYGFEVALFYRPVEEVTLFFDWGYARGKVDQVSGTGADLGEQPLGKVGPSMIHLGARWQAKETGTWVEALWTAAAEQTHLSVTDNTDTQRIPPGGTPGYGMLTLRGGFLIEKKVAVSLAVENVFDKDYRVHGSGQNEPGIGVVLGVDAKF